VVYSRCLPDDFDATVHAFRIAAGLTGEEGADVIVTSGGVSVGDHDYVKPALEKLGSLHLWRVQMKPGKPLAFGQIDDTLFLGLPGNPVSTMVTFELFVRPVLWRLGGRERLDRPRLPVRLDTLLRHTPGRREYVRAVCWVDGDRFAACPTGAQGSGVLTSMLGANSLLVVPEDSAGYEPGESAEAILLSAPFDGPPA
jgi:molybdopterin biosynthesis enzyme